LAADQSLYAVVQPTSNNPFEKYMFDYISRTANMHVEQQVMTWQQSWESSVALDVGMAVYRHQGSQFQKMGISSNRLCMFLAMGVPVIGNRQPSYEFLERFGCGLMVADSHEFQQALDYIRRNLVAMRQACKTCFDEYIMPPGRYEGLSKAIAEVINPTRA
jgi:hypothetical protein